MYRHLQIQEEERERTGTNVEGLEHSFRTPFDTEGENEGEKNARVLLREIKETLKPRNKVMVVIKGKLR